MPSPRAAIHGTGTRPLPRSRDTGAVPSVPTLAGKGFPVGGKGHRPMRVLQPWSHPEVSGCRGQEV